MGLLYEFSASGIVIGLLSTYYAGEDMFSEKTFILPCYVSAFQ
jgi:hypothetical protein